MKLLPSLLLTAALLIPSLSQAHISHDYPRHAYTLKQCNILADWIYYIAEGKAIGKPKQYFIDIVNMTDSKLSIFTHLVDDAYARNDVPPFEWATLVIEGCINGTTGATLRVFH